MGVTTLKLASAFVFKLMSAFFSYLSANFPKNLPKDIVRIILVSAIRVMYIYFLETSI